MDDKNETLTLQLQNCETFKAQSVNENDKYTKEIEELREKVAKLDVELKYANHTIGILSHLLKK